MIYKFYQFSYKRILKLIYSYIYNNDLYNGKCNLRMLIALIIMLCIYLQLREYNSY